MQGASWVSQWWTHAKRLPLRRAHSRSVVCPAVPRWRGARPDNMHTIESGLFQSITLLDHTHSVICTVPSWPLGATLSGAPLSTPGGHSVSCPSLLPQMIPLHLIYGFGFWQAPVEQRCNLRCCQQPTFFIFLWGGVAWDTESPPMWMASITHQMLFGSIPTQRRSMTAHLKSHGTAIWITMHFNQGLYIWL